MHQLRMRFKCSAQSRRISRIQQIDSAAKDGVFDALVVRKLESRRQLRGLHMRLQPRPARESVLARNGQLRVAELQRGSENRRRPQPAKPRMKFADALRTPPHRGQHAPLSRSLAWYFR